MSKHTPGPWIGAGPSFGDPLPRYTTSIVTEWADEYGDYADICELPFHHHDDENEANALLIAAAPDLLVALRAASKMLHPDWEEYQLACAAITKATGAQA